MARASLRGVFRACEYGTERWVRAMWPRCILRTRHRRRAWLLSSCSIVIPARRPAIPRKATTGSSAVRSGRCSGDVFKGSVHPIVIAPRNLPAEIALKLPQWHCHTNDRGALEARVIWRMATISFARHQFPPAIIRHAVWLYVRLTLSRRDVEELLAERGLDVSYETDRRWVLKFGPFFARELRRRRSRPTSHWQLDEMAVMISGKQFGCGEP